MKVGDQQDGEEGVMGHHGLHGERSENGERYVELCASNNMVITSTMLPHKDIHKHTWVSPDNRTTKNQIDHGAVSGKFRRLMLDTHAFRGADVKSDHHLVIAKIKLRLCRSGKKVNISKKYNVAKLDPGPILFIGHSLLNLQLRFLTEQVKCDSVFFSVSISGCISIAFQWLFNYQVLLL